jgi:hypothetical protein
VRVVIDNAALRRNRSCKGAYTNREWDEKEQALIFPDWDASVEELLSTEKGLARLEWYVRHNLVPMTMDEFIAAKSARGGPSE